jgi:hypothetical protein
MLSYIESIFYALMKYWHSHWKNIKYQKHLEGLDERGIRINNKYTVIK